MREVRPAEVYNLGAQSHVRVSFDVPEYTAEVTALGAIRILEAIRETGIRPRFYQLVRITVHCDLEILRKELYGNPRP